MGRPYNDELLEVRDTIKSAQNEQNSNFADSLGLKLINSQGPIYFVGSGGSLTACHFACNLQNEVNKNGFVRTPYDLMSNPYQVFKSHVVVITARGMNKDIVNAIHVALRFGCGQVSVLILAKSSLIHRKFENHERVNIYEFNVLKKKDGFLSVNSLVAFCTIFLKTYNYQIPEIDLSKQNETKTFFNATAQIDDFFVIHNYWTQAVALDLESKFTEAALGNIKLSDFRNFGHGRHHWLAKRPSTGIIFLVSPSDIQLLDKTIRLLPQNINVLILDTKESGANSAYDLLIRSLNLSYLRGVELSIDPGRPGVPDFGRKLYGLNYKIPQRDVNINDSIERKLIVADTSHQNQSLLKKWKDYYSDFRKSITDSTFRAIVFDYDGTICSTKRTFIGPDDEIKSSIIQLLDHNIIVAFATGRGDSIRKDLRSFIPQHYWKDIIVAYYNGVQISDINDNNTPYQNELINADLSELINYIKSILPELEDQIETQKNHLALRLDKLKHNFKAVKQLLKHKVNLSNNKLRVLESSHSIDIFSLDDSKLSIIDYLVRKKSIQLDEILTIGDKGFYPGNDFELLSIKNSLSVDEVSPDPYSCWNLTPIGLTNSESVKIYLKAISFQEVGFFKLSDI